jgi:hypothetical protein
MRTSGNKRFHTTPNMKKDLKATHYWSIKFNYDERRAPSSVTDRKQYQFYMSSGQSRLNLMYGSIFFFFEANTIDRNP